MRWVITGAVILVLGVAAGTSGWWAVPFLQFLDDNGARVQSLANLIQIVLWMVAGIGAVVGLWWARKRPGNRAQPAPPTNRTQRVEGNRNVTVGGDITGSTIITGDDSHVIR